MKSTQTKTVVAVASGLALLTLPIASFADDGAGTLSKSKGLGSRRANSIS